LGLPSRIADTNAAAGVVSAILGFHRFTVPIARAPNFRWLNDVVADDALVANNREMSLPTADAPSGGVGGGNRDQNSKQNMVEVIVLC
jgi:hypothetical protein